MVVLSALRGYRITGQNEEGCWQRLGELSVQNSKEDNPKAGGSKWRFYWGHTLVQRGLNFPEKIVSGGDEHRPARQKVSSAWLA